MKERETEEKLVRPGCSRSFITLETNLELAMDKPSV